MAGGSRGRRTYARDNRGRFASTGASRSRPAPKQAATRGTNRLTRNNSGQIVGVGRNGATARGGRLRTAAGNQRATQTARLRTAKPAGTIKTKSLSPEANFRIIRQQKGRFPKVGAAAQAMQKRGALKNSGDIEQLAAIAKKAMASFRKQQAGKPVSKPAKAAKPAPRQLKAPKRLSFEIQYHGTNRQAAKAIRLDGFKESRSGVWGGGVYSSSRKKTATAYTPRDNGTMLRLLVPRSSSQRFPVERPGNETSMRGRNRAIGVTRIQNPLLHGGGRPGQPLFPSGKGSKESWLISPASKANQWLDRRQVIPVPRGRRKPKPTKLAKPAKPATPRGPATSRLRPGELMNAVARPVNTMARPKRGRNPYQSGIAKMDYQISATNDDKKARLANAQATKAMFESKGLSVKYNSSRGSSTVASYNPATKEMTINRSHVSWVNPAAAGIKQRRRGQMSSSSPMHTFFHEMGHARDKNLLSRSVPLGQFWVLATRKGPSDEARVARGNQMQQLARRVSRYATTNPSEFIAETYAGLKTGRRYDYQVMRAYREAMGLPPTPAARRRSRVRRAKP